jgi:hypothetical protein
MVDFPDPLAPTMAVNLPAGADRLTFLRTVTGCQHRLLELGGGVPSGREG